MGRSLRDKLFWANMEEVDEGEAVMIILEYTFFEISMYAEDREKSREQHDWPEATN